MRGFVRFVAMFAVLVAFLILVVLPLVVGPFLTQVVRDMGMRSDTLAVSVAMFDPLLVLGRSRSAHVSATNVDLHPAAIGSLELTLGDVRFFDRTWQRIEGEIADVSVSVGRDTLRVGSISVTGPAASAVITARLGATDGESLIRAAAERQGVLVDDVRFDATGLTVTIKGASAVGRLEVRGGALVLFPGPDADGIPLVQPAPADPWQLEEAWISAEGVNVRGVVDTTQLVALFNGGAARPEGR